jgi:hypothetical protein
MYQIFSPDFKHLEMFKIVFFLKKVPIIEYRGSSSSGSRFDKRTRTDGRTDGRPDMAKVVGAFRDYAKAPKSVRYSS